jgi:hypothetical protein
VVRNHGIDSCKPHDLNADSLNELLIRQARENAAGDVARGDGPPFGENDDRGEDESEGGGDDEGEEDLPKQRGGGQ